MKKGRECYHCKQWIEDVSTHDCWTTTPEALTRDLPEDLREAWARLRETALGLGEQRMYASHSSIMFSRQACYFFVRPRPKYLELCVFLGRPLTAPQVRKAAPSSTVKFYNIIRITHRDEVEPPITDWVREAYDVSDSLSGRQLPTSKPPLPTRKTRSQKPGATSQKPKTRRQAPKAKSQKPRARRPVNSPSASAKSSRPPAPRAVRGGRRAPGRRS